MFFLKVGKIMQASYRLLDLLESDSTKSSHELLNQSGILSNVEVDEVPILLNSVASLKNDLKGDILKKVKRSVIANG